MQNRGNTTHRRLRHPSFLFTFDVLSPVSVAVLEHEREETKEAESYVARLRRQGAAQREAVAALDADIEQYRARVANLRNGRSSPYIQYFRPFETSCPTERELERKTLAMHISPTSADLRACERAWRCVIEGVGPEQLLIRYFFKDGQGSHSTGEASFVLDVSSPSPYKGTSQQLHLLYP